MTGRLAACALAVGLPLLALGLPGSAAAAEVAPDPAALVDPLIGTEGNGHTFPGADVPFGMVQFSPVSVGGGAGGYRYAETRLSGFGLTRLSGAGCTNYGDVPLMPTAGPPPVSPASEPDRFAEAFSHRSEVAEPGSYRVRLSSGISVALTVTTRTGLAVFTYPASAGRGTLLVEPSEAANPRMSTIRVLGRDRVVGSARSAPFGGACGHPRSSYTVYFALAFEHPFRSFGTWSGSRLLLGSRESGGPHAGAFLSFDTRQRESVRVKIGISFVSVSNALLNLAREGRSWSFAEVRAHARARWDRLLDRIRIEGGARRDREVFYTALYHAFLHPNVFSDVDGKYLGRDGHVHAAQGYTRYTNFSGWDIYRSQIPLLALLTPAETSDMVRSLVADGAEAGWLSRWLLANVETGLMVGDPSDAVIADAYAFGARNFDAALALREMLLGANTPELPAPSGSAGPNGYVERPALAQYLGRGYIAGGASTTLEYALADFAISQLAEALGDEPDYETFLTRSGSWRNTFDPQTGFVEPRLGNGNFPANFQPTSGIGFVEGDAWQYTLMVPHDMADLLAAIGPASREIRKLDRFFSKLDAGPRAPNAWLGNEPSFSAPFAYLWLGAPSHTQAVVRRALATLFTSQPDGLPGNDDLGAISSWYLWAALGLYPVIPGVAGFAVVSPLFPRATITLGTGKQITIVASGAGPYTRGLTLDGAPYDAAWLPLARLAAGARLRFTLSPTPSGWASRPQAAPPSFSSSNPAPTTTSGNTP